MLRLFSFPHPRKELSDNWLASCQRTTCSRRAFFERMERILRTCQPEHHQRTTEVATESTSKTPTTWAGKFRGLDMQDLVKRQRQGSVTAEKILKTLSHNLVFLQLWEECEGRPDEEQKEKLVDLMYICVSGEPHVLSFPHLNLVHVFFRDLLQQEGKRVGDLDRKVRICFGNFFVNNGEVDDETLEVTKEGHLRYPDEIIFFDQLASFYGLRGEYQKGLDIAEKGLVRWSRHVKLLYNQAVFKRLLGGPRDKKVIREAYKQFLDVAPKDHRKVPEAWYCTAVTFLKPHIAKKVRGGVSTCVEFEMMKKFWRKGLEAEEVQLNCYLPYNSTSKQMLEPVMAAFGVPTKLSSSPSKPISEVKAESSAKPVQGSGSVKSNLYLANPKRISLIKTHRHFIKEMMLNAPSGGTHVSTVTASKTPRLVHKLPPNIADLKIIHLNEMDSMHDHIYEKRIVNLTLIDDPLFGFASVHTLVQDENGDVTQLHVYKVPQNQETYETLGFGCTLSVINPYFRCFADETTGIRVDDPRCLVSNDARVDPCRYCGEENAINSCGKCKWAKYCGRECQVADWKKLNHKGVCQPRNP